MPPPDLEQLKTRHPSLTEVSVAIPGGALELWLRSPTREEYKRFLAQVNDPAKKPDALENIAYVCTVFPDRAALDAIFDRFPILAPKVAEKALDLAGAGLSVEKKD